MAPIRHLSKAPITEALLDFKIQPSVGDHHVFSDLVEVRSVGYKIVENINKVQFESAFNPKEGLRQSMRDHGIVGYRYISEDRTRIAQFRIDGFTFNMLKPYSTWEDMTERALALWRIYVDAGQPQLLTRIATRFINHLNFPLNEDINNFLETLLHIPNGLPEIMRDFEIRVALEDQEGFTTLINQSILEVTEDTISILVDIDTFKAFEQVSIEESQTEMLRWLDQLHDLKNRAFFGLIKDKAIQLYQ